ncbi:hypothetical protein ABZ070_18340 [Streptomyces sp. NPDC006283]|uniref:Hsp70 family protein n=1 Tax=Streptomyces sp. NPDC006283 TaxID=3156741 RepID=UPI0033A11AD0
MTDAGEGRVAGTPAEGLVIGLDLGDGETTLAWTPTGGVAQNRIYERRATGERSVLTAMARSAADRRRLLGEEAVSATGAAEFSLNFKHGPALTGLETPEPVLFVQSLLAEFLAEFFSEHENGGQPGADATGTVLEPLLVVGHPAGWEESVVRAYAAHLTMRGVRTRLLPESQAALVHVSRPAHPDGLSFRAVREQMRRQTLLVIDIGSSTTDFTVVGEGEPTSLPLGADFGCRSIDRQVADRVIDSLADRAELVDALAQDGGREFLLLACRRAKEAQCSGSLSGIMDMWVNPRFQPVVDLAWDWLRGLEITALITAPGGWADEFRELLEKAREMSSSPDRIVLTGGGSRMLLTRRLCAQVFPGATIENDSEPSFSVAKGLALAGHTEIRLDSFRDAVTELLEGDRFDEVCSEHIRTGFDQLKRRLAAYVKAGRLAHRNTGVAQEALLELVQEEPEPAAIDDLRIALNEELGSGLSVICRDHGVPDDALDLDFRLPLGVAQGLTEQLQRYVGREGELNRFTQQWFLWAQNMMLQQQQRSLNPLQPRAPGHPAVQMAQAALKWGAPPALLLLSRRAQQKMVREIEALSLGQEHVDDQLGTIREHIRGQLLDRIREIEELIF